MLAMLTSFQSLAVWGKRLRDEALEMKMIRISIYPSLSRNEARSVRGKKSDSDFGRML